MEPNNGIFYELPCEARRRRNLRDSAADKCRVPEDTDAANTNREPGLTKEEESRCWATTVYDGISSRSLDVTKIPTTSADNKSPSGDEVLTEDDRRRNPRSPYLSVDTAKNVQSSYI